MASTLHPLTRELLAAPQELASDLGRQLFKQVGRGHPGNEVYM